jgi:hypothetical protein
MTRNVWWLAVATLLVVRPLAAQNTQQDDSERTEHLRQQVEGRFAERVRERLQLSDDQMTRLRGTARTYGARRRELVNRERDVRAALADQLRPGIAANQDSVSRLTDALVSIRSAQAQALRDENREMAEYLTPVQRSQVFVMRERLMRRAHEIQHERQDERRDQLRGMGGRPGPAGADDSGYRPRAPRAQPHRGRP